MELHQLRYFHAVAECGNMSRAAHRCNVAQPSLSQQLQKLETTLGVRLFDRLKRGVALTDAGRSLLPRVRQILADVREIEANLLRESADCFGVLSVGAIPTMAPYLLPPALEKLRSMHPQCQVSVREDLTEHLAEALANLEIDCALLSTPLEHELLDVEVLGEEELLVVVPASHPSSGQETIGISDLRGQPTVSLEDMHCLGRQIQGFCATRHVAPQVVCRTTQIATIVELVALEMGISIVPEMAAASDRSGRCRYLRLHSGKPMRQIAVAWRRGRTRPLAAVRFIEWVKENLGRGGHRLRESGNGSGPREMRKKRS